ncbi:helix-turn-helix domain-containing protein [Lysinibacillus sp. NPDC093216]|uniref:helix-turn-helix domain-containing protein n=1 Tax=Lysinibacillus sp. NPDC093216 TaxID=3390576 RepID=UPI003D05F29B
MFHNYFGEDYKSFGEFLKKQRLGKDISQADLAEKIGISQQSITFYESDKRLPSVKIIASYAKAIGVDKDELYKMRTEAVLNRELVLANNPDFDRYPTEEERREIDKLHFSSMESDQVESDEIADLDFTEEPFTIDGEPLTEEELEKATEYIRALRIMKNQNKNK